LRDVGGRREGLRGGSHSERHARHRVMHAVQDLGRRGMQLAGWGQRLGLRRVRVCVCMCVCVCVYVCVCVCMCMYKLVAKVCVCTRACSPRSRQTWDAVGGVGSPVGAAQSARVCICV